MFDSGKLAEQDTREEFKLNIESRLEALPDHANAPEVEGLWSSIKRVYTEAAEEVLGRRRKREEEWISEEAWRIIKEKKEPEGED